MRNLFEDLPCAASEEVAEELVARPGFRVERITSRGQCSPPGFWYDQAEDEWVVVLAGRARLRLERESRAREMTAGDWVFIPAGERHRVEWTDPEEDTVWLAAFRSASV